MSLYQLAQDDDMETLADRARSSDSDAVRRRAAKMLGDRGEIDDDEVVDTLIRLALGDEDERVRGAAVDGLSELGTEALERLLAEDAGIDPGEADWTAVRAFADALGSTRPEYRMAAASALGRIGDTDALRPLVRRLSDPDERVRERVCYALGRIDDPRAVDPLTDRLGDDADRVRQSAADALASIGSNGALAALLDLLDDESAAIRRVAASALGEAGSARPVPPLVEAMQDDHGAVRRAAVFSVIRLLSSAPTDQSHQVREAIVSELEGLDDRAVVDPLLEVLDEASDAGQRRNAVWLLGRVTGEDPPDRVVETLIETLADDDRMTAQFASTSVTELDGLSVESSLIDMVTDDDYTDDARARAAYALGEVGGDRAREVLDRMTNEDTPEAIRKRAFSALSKLGGVRQ